MGGVGDAGADSLPQSSPAGAPQLPPALLDDPSDAPLVPTTTPAPALAPPPPPADGAAPSHPPRTARWALYAAHALSASVGRGWEFGGALALLALAPDTLALPAALGLAESLAQALGGASIGRAVDRWARYTAAARFVGAQAACTLLSAGAVLAALHWREGGPGSPPGLTPRTIGLGALAIAGAAGAALGAAGAAVSVEREWSAALAGGDSAALASLNAGMRRIDLVALVAAPAVVGAVLSSAGPSAGTALVAGAAAVAVAPQLALLALAQRLAPDRLGGGGGRSGGGGGGATAATAAATPTLPSKPPRRPGAALKTYAAAPAFPAGAALALLYGTVLSFGPTMTAYLQWRGLGAAELAGWRGAGAVAGLAATFAFPPARRAWGLDAAGGAGLGVQWVCLAPALLAASAAPTLPAARGLAAGLALSRAGLWAFDLVAAQALQERVPPGSLGTVNGVQFSAQAAAGALAAGVCLAVPDPAHFVWLMVASLVVVSGASGVFWVGTGLVRRRERRAAAVELGSAS